MIIGYALMRSSQKMKANIVLGNYIQKCAYNIPN